MYKSLAFCAFALFLTAAACDSATTPPESTAPPIAYQTITASSETFVAGQYGNYDFDERRNLVIHNEADFRAFWKALHEGRSPIPPLPEIDFSEKTVVAALLGTQPTGGYDIEIEHLAFSADRPVRVRVETTVPGEGCAVTTALTSPYHVVKVGGADLQFDFEDERVVRDC